VEVREGLALVGIGLNVRQGPEDFPEAVRGIAGSIRMLSESNERLSRLDVLGTLLVELGALLEAGPAGVRERWRELDVLVGTTQCFDTARGRVPGRVLRLDPLEEIVVETDGGVVTLPAATTRVAKEGGQRAGS
jgi:biotin-(acetyl-CoA carboxylase) ligase